MRVLLLCYRRATRRPVFVGSCCPVLIPDRAWSGLTCLFVVDALAEKIAEDMSKGD